MSYPGMNKAVKTRGKNYTAGSSRMLKRHIGNLQSARLLCTSVSFAFHDIGAFPGIAQDFDTTIEAGLIALRNLAPNRIVTEAMSLSVMSCSSPR